MKRALREMRVEGVMTNIPFHLKVLDDESFREGDIDTTFIVRKRIIEQLVEEGNEALAQQTRVAAVISAALAMSEDGMEKYLEAGPAAAAGEARCVSKWKLAGRQENMGGRGA